MWKRERCVAVVDFGPEGVEREWFAEVAFATRLPLRALVKIDDKGDTTMVRAKGFEPDHSQLHR
jgi:hypothetical protein